VGHHLKEIAMAKPNYQFEKRQRELEKKKAKEEKAQRKAQAAQDNAAPVDAESVDEAKEPETPTT